MSNIRVTILMPVYNAAPYLGESISSMLNQTYSDFLFLIINDGSTDNSEEIIQSFTDSRIWYHSNDRNRGLIYTLNVGLRMINTEYIVRMDADDISLPDRLDAQVKFMDENKDIGASGGQLTYFGDLSSTTDFPVSHNSIVAKMLFAHKINHPTAIIRNEIVKANHLEYDSNYIHIEDYDFWRKLSKHAKLGNIDKVVLKYRWQGQNITAKNWETRNSTYLKIYGQILNDLKIPVTEINLKLHLDLSGNSFKLEKLEMIKKHATMLIQQNMGLKIYPEAELRNEIAVAWDKLFYKVVDTKSGQLFRYWKISKSIKFGQIRYVLGNFIRKLFRKTT